MDENLVKEVFISLGENSYTIHIGSSVLRDKAVIQQAINTKQICIVTNKVIADLYLDDTVKIIKNNNDIKIKVVIIPEGEPNKSQDTLDKIYDCLIENKFSRDCLIIALGGGIVGDIAGFAAANYQRGVNFIQVPTTLLAQVDSSVGGKTGINHRLGKNLIGAFHQPKKVIIDTNVLSTLPKKEISAGMAEVIKYGLIRDYDFLLYLDNNLDNIMSLDSECISEVIRISCYHKAKIVENDEKEKGERAILNLGHTFGHAIEAITNYKSYLHGEAVAIGIMMSLEISKLLGYLEDIDIEFVENLFIRSGCPTHLYTKSDAYEIRETMQRDKKVRGGKLKLILIDKLGKAIIRDDIDEGLIINSIENRLIS